MSNYTLPAEQTIDIYSTSRRKQDGYHKRTKPVSTYYLTLGQPKIEVAGQFDRVI